MASEVVQFRESAEAVAYLRERGINPNEFGKDAFQRALRLRQMREAHDRLAKVKGPTRDEIVRAIREMRDTM